MRHIILALLFSTAVFAHTTSSEDAAGQLGSGARTSPAFGSGAGFMGSGY